MKIFIDTANIEQIKEVQNKLNDRLRKVLNYLKPNEVFN